MTFKRNFVAVLKCDGNILREREPGVFNLPFGSEYSILLKNKDSRRALVHVEVDGTSVYRRHGLILPANSSVEVRGFMLNMRETCNFKFIKKTKEIQGFRCDRPDDGLIRISFKFEKPESHYSPYYQLYTQYTGLDQSLLGTDAPYLGPVSYSTTTSTSFDSMSKGGESCGRDRVFSSVSLLTSPLADEGITVKGKRVKADYTYGEIGELETDEHVIILQLKGLADGREEPVKKPLTVSTRIRCETCGRSHRSDSSYCSNCGTYLS